MFLLSLAAAFPAGGAYSALLFCVAKMLRDAPGYIWFDFKRKFKENVKQAAPLGIIYAAFVYTEIFLLGSLLYGGADFGAGGVVLVLSPGIVSGIVAPYIFLMVAHIDLKTSQIIKNSVLISFSNLIRSFAGMLAGGAIWVVFFLFLPVSLVFAPVFFIFGFSLSGLLCLMWIWPPVNERFSIEKTLNDLQLRADLKGTN